MTNAIGRSPKKQNDCNWADHIRYRVLVYFLLLGCLTAPPLSTTIAAEPRLEEFGAEHVVYLQSLRQQLLDIDAWQTTQFKKSAWRRLAQWLQAYLVATDKSTSGRKVAIEQLRNQRFRPCIPQTEYAAFKDQLNRLKDDGTKLKSKAPLKISEDLIEVFAVLEAAYLGLYEASQGWERKSAKDANIEATIVASLNDYQLMQRRIAKVRLVIEQPEWIRNWIFKGKSRDKDIEQARALLAAIDGNGSLSNLSALTNSADAREALKPETADVQRERRDTLEKLSQLITDTFRKEADAILRRASEISKSSRDIAIEIPKDALVRGVYAMRTVLRAIPGSADRFEADVALCQPLMAQNSIKLDLAKLDLTKLSESEKKAAQACAVPQQAFDQIDLGITITNVIVKNGVPQIMKPGLASNVRLDHGLLASAVRRFGVPAALNIEETQVDKIADDLSSVTLLCRMSVPGTGCIFKGTFPVVPGSWNGKLPVADIFVSQIDLLQNTFLTAVNKTPTELAVPGGTIRLSNWENLSRWRDGVLAFQADVSCGEFGTWKLPLEVFRDGDTWKIRPGAHVVPDTVRAKLVSLVRTELFRALDQLPLPDGIVKNGAKARDFIEKLRGFSVLEELKFDAGKGEFIGSFKLPADIFPGIQAFDAVEVRLPLATATPVFDIRSLQEQIKLAFPRLVEQLVQQSLGNLADKLAADLKGKKLSLFGQTLEIVEVGRFDENRKGYAVTVQLNAGSTVLKVERLWLLGLSMPIQESLKSVRFDFSEIKTSPAPEKFLQAILGSAFPSLQKYLQVSDIRLLPDGIHASLRIQCEALGGSLPAIELVLGSHPDTTALTAQLESALSEVIVTQLGKGLVLAELGPVKNLTLDKDHTKIGPSGVVIYIGGSLAVESFENLEIPFSVQIFPKLDINSLKITEPVQNAFQTWLTSNVKIPGDTGIQIQHLKVKTTAPYGISFDASVNIWIFSIEIGRMAITQRGIELPEKISARFPGSIPAGIFAIVKPGVGFYLKGQGKLDILGDITFLSDGIDHVVKIRSTMTADPKELKFSLTGQLVLLDFLPIFGVDGEVKFDQLRIELTGRSLPPIDKLLQIHGHTLGDGQRMVFEQTADMGVLGLNLFEMSVLIDGRQRKVRANGSVHLLVGDGSIGIDAEPNFSRIHGRAELKVHIDRWEISGAVVDIDPGLVKLQGSILGLAKITVVVPTVSALTPKLLLDAILSMFDFDIEGFFRAIINRDIVISLVDGKGKSTNGTLGQGEPLGNNTPSPDQMPGGESGGLPGESRSVIPSTSNHGEPGDAPNSTTGVGIDTPIATPRNDRPTEVFTYREGNATIRFENDPRAPGKKVEITEFGANKWESHFSIEPSIADTLKNPSNMILDQYWCKLSGNARVRCRFGYEHPFVPVYVVLQKDGRVLMAGMYPGGQYQELSVPELAEIGERVQPANLWDWAVKNRDKRFTSGDIEMIREYVRAKFTPEFGGFKWLRRIPGPQGKAEDDAYLYQRTEDDGKKSLVFRSRGGLGFSVTEGTPLAAVFEDQSQEALSKNTVRLVMQALTKNEPVRILGIQDQKVLIIRQNSDGMFWLDCADGAKDNCTPVRLFCPTLNTEAPKRTPLQMAFHPTFGRLGDPAWPSGTSFLGSFAREVSAAGPTDEVWLSELEKSDNRIAIFGRAIDKPEWSVRMVSESKSGTAELIPAKVGKDIAAGYKKWVDNGSVLQTTTIRSLDLPDSRRFLLGVLTGPRKKWPESFNSNPLGLLAP